MGEAALASAAVAGGSSMMSSAMTGAVNLGTKGMDNQQRGYDRDLARDNARDVFHQQARTFNYSKGLIEKQGKTAAGLIGTQGKVDTGLMETQGRITRGLIRVQGSNDSNLIEAQGYANRWSNTSLYANINDRNQKSFQLQKKLDNNTASNQRSIVQQNEKSQEDFGNYLQKQGVSIGGNGYRTANYMGNLNYRTSTVSGAGVEGASVAAMTARMNNTGNPFATRRLKI